MTMTDEDIREHVSTREQALARVRKLLTTQLRLPVAPDEIDPDIPLFSAGLGLDSIDAVELVVALQREFGLRLAEGDATVASLRTVNTLVERVIAHERRKRVAP